MTKIEWTEATWNPLAGCTIVSPGCTNCYAMKMAARIEKMLPDKAPQYRGLTKPSKAGPVWTGKVALAPEHILTEPLRRKKPTMWFVNSMSDLFHEDVPDEWIDTIFAIMAMSRQHTFQVLTKRAKRMYDYFNPPRRTLEYPPGSGIMHMPQVGGLPNVWLGVSAERQQEADERIPYLVATRSAVRFVSAEPLLGPIDFTRIRAPNGDQISALRQRTILTAKNGTITIAGKSKPMSGPIEVSLDEPRLNWIIVGGESGAGARWMHPDWARSIREQCIATGTAFFFKQWGHWASDHEVPAPESVVPRFVAQDGRDVTDRWLDNDLAMPMWPAGKAKSGSKLDGREWKEMPRGAA